MAANNVPFASPLDNPVLAEGWFSKRGKKIHEGMDFVGDRMKVYAIAGGTVTHSKWVSDGGHLIVIHHDEPPFVGYSSRYCHLNKRLVEKYAKPGADAVSWIDGRAQTRVKRGQPIGISGNTGTNTTAPHLHLDIQAVKEIVTSLVSKVGRKCVGHEAPGGVGRSVPGELFVNFTPRILEGRRAVTGEFVPPPAIVASLGPDWQNILAPQLSDWGPSASSESIPLDVIDAVKAWAASQQPQQDAAPLQYELLGMGPSGGEIFAASFTGALIVAGTIVYVKNRR